MKSEKLIKLLGMWSCCLLLGGCAGVNARVQETEVIREETQQSEIETDTEESIVEKSTEENVEAEQVMDQSQETGTSEEVMGEKETARSEQETETEWEEEKQVFLKYKVEDQELEIGKSFSEIKVPEYAETEDGSKVIGKLEWRRPGSAHILDSEMVLTGSEGEKRTWEWSFVPDDKKYEIISGTVEITMRDTDSSENQDEMATINELWKKKDAKEDTKKDNGGSSASGSTIGSVNVIKISDIEEAAKWMGSLMTGTGVLGEGKENYTREAGKENFNVAHGTVIHEKENAETQTASELETESVEIPKKEKNAGTVQTLRKMKTDDQETATENDSESGAEAAEWQKEKSGLTHEEAKRYGRYGMTVFAMSQAVSQIVHGNTLK